MSLVILFSDLDPRKGGVQVSGIDVVSAFDRRGLSAIVYGSDPTGALKDSAVTVIDSSKWQLARRVAMRRWRQDMALVWHVGMLPLLLLLRGFRGRLILFLHGIELWRRHGWLTRRLLRRVDLFLSNSDYTWERFLHHAPYLRGRMHVTAPLGFGEPFGGSIPEPNSRPSAIVLGRIMKNEGYKGHRELIAAWPQVLTQLPTARLEIVGDGDLRSDLETLVDRAHLGESIQFHGRVSEERKQSLLAESRCLALPSRGEGFGLVYLEAMRVGRPCLVSDCDAGQEVVNPPESGLAVDVQNPESLVNGIVRLLSDGEDWRTWSLAARRRYEQNYTAARFIERIRNAI